MRKHKEFLPLSKFIYFYHVLLVDVRILTILLSYVRRAKQTSNEILLV